MVPDRRAKSQPPQIDTWRCLLMPRYKVICEWSDAGIEDADEIVVVTPTPAQAVEKAREKWLRTIGSQSVSYTHLTLPTKA